MDWDSDDDVMSKDRKSGFSGKSVFDPATSFRKGFIFGKSSMSIFSKGGGLPSIGKYKEDSDEDHPSGDEQHEEVKEEVKEEEGGQEEEKEEGGQEEEKIAKPSTPEEIDATTEKLFQEYKNIGIEGLAEKLLIISAGDKGTLDQLIDSYIQIDQVCADRESPVFRGLYYASLASAEDLDFEELEEHLREKKNQDIEGPDWNWLGPIVRSLILPKQQQEEIIDG